MVKSITSLILLIISVFLSFKHGWETFHYKNNPKSINIMSEIGISEPLLPVFGILTFMVGVFLLIPKTFFLGNVLNAILILLIMALSLKNDNFKIALIEIPFLAIPLIMIWLKYPFKN